MNAPIASDQRNSLQKAELQSKVVRGLEANLPSSSLLWNREDTTPYECDGLTAYRQPPMVVVLPDTTAQVSQVLKYCHEHAIKVVPRGSGTGLSGGSVALEQAVVLSLLRLNRILEIDRANMTASLEPGVITAQLHAAVEAQGLFYPPDPGSMKICTVGGNVAENAGGLRGLKYGVTRDYVMGLEVVLPDGREVQIRPAPRRVPPPVRA